MDNYLKELYEENAKLVYKYLLSLCHDSFLAEELVQETFYQAMKSIDRYNGTCKMSVWLCQIGKHLWYREQKRKSRFSKIEYEKMENTLFLDKDVEEVVCEKETKIELYKNIHSLTSPTREVMYLRLSGNLSFAEIGEILNKSENWARVTYYRGKQKIKEDKSYEK